MVQHIRFFATSLQFFTSSSANRSFKLSPADRFTVPEQNISLLNRRSETEIGLSKSTVILPLLFRLFVSDVRA